MSGAGGGGGLQYEMPGCECFFGFFLTILIYNK